MTENTKKNYTEIGLVWPNKDRPGYTGVVTSAVPLLLSPGRVTLLVSPHPRVDGAHQVSAMIDAPQRKAN
jgi:hypothetical protein